ncbi:MAG: nucleotidyltransferase domain-containing protein [Promethearchaeota archaeon]
MVDKKLMKDLRENFDFTLQIPEILGVMLYGSQVRGDITNRSDVDICIVTQKKPTGTLLLEILERQPHPKEIYSIFFFHELPLYIKKDIFNEGIVIVSRDVPALYEFFFYYRKIWEDEAYIIRNA